MGRTLQLACLLLLFHFGGEAWARRPPPESRMARPNDVGIAAALSEEFQRQPGLHGRNLEIRVVDGVAVLTGHVEDLLSAERAIRVARASFGVRAVVDLVELRTPERSDLQLTGAIRTAWALDPVVEVHELELEVRDGRAILRGTVDSEDEREVAERIVRGIPGVRGVDNGLRVEVPPERRDGEIRAEIVSRLRWEPGLASEGIEVQVRQGRVTLEGTVGTEDQRQHAATLARARGVHGVVNRIAVDPSSGLRALRLSEPWVPDRELKSAVRAAIEQIPRSGGDGIRVTVRDGVVRLVGAVADEASLHRIVRAAEGALGCRGVEPRLTVKAASIGPADPRGS